MKLRFLVLPLAVVLLTITAHAQAGLYFTPVAVRVTNSQADSGPFAFLGQNATSQMFYGVNMGGYYDFSRASKVQAGVDVRDILVHGSNASLNSLLFGFRLSDKPFKLPFKAYIEPVIGVGRTRSQSASLYKSNEEYGVFGGVDYTFRPHIDWRIVEVGYNSLSTINSTDFGGTTPFSASGVLSISTGLVFRIH